MMLIFLHKSLQWIISNILLFCFAHERVLENWINQVKCNNHVFLKKLKVISFNNMFQWISLISLSINVILNKLHTTHRLSLTKYTSFMQNVAFGSVVLCFIHNVCSTLYGCKQYVIFIFAEKQRILLFTSKCVS